MDSVDDFSAGSGRLRHGPRREHFGNLLLRVRLNAPLYEENPIIWSYLDFINNSQMLLGIIWLAHYINLSLVTTQDSKPQLPLLRILRPWWRRQLDLRHVGLDLFDLQRLRERVHVGDCIPIYRLLLHGLLFLLLVLVQVLVTPTLVLLLLLLLLPLRLSFKVRLSLRFLRLLSLLNLLGLLLPRLVVRGIVFLNHVVLSLHLCQAPAHDGVLV